MVLVLVLVLVLQLKLNGKAMKARLGFSTDQGYLITLMQVRQMF